MSLSTEFARFSAIDLGKTGETFSATKESLSAVSGGLNALYGADDEVMDAVNMCCGALQILTGFASLGRLAKAVTESRTVAKTAEAVALTTLNSTTPIGWGKIALATGTMAAVSTVMYATVSTIRLGSFDLSTSSGQGSAVRAVMGAMA